MKKLSVIFDLDGTIAIIDERRIKSLKPDNTIDWDIFFNPENIQLDKPNYPVILTLQALYDQNYSVIIFSGRSDRTKDATLKWLRNNGVFHDKLVMRKEGDHTPDDELKQQFLDDLLTTGTNKNDILCVFDDRDKVVKMWRDNNIPCFQVNYGDF